MKKISKITIFFCIFIMLFSVIYQVSAVSIWKWGRDFLQTGKDQTGMLEETKKVFGDFGNSKQRFEELIDFLWGIGLLTIFISTVILGIRYMLVLPNERSRIKEATFPYIIGVVIIFGALTIWKIIILVLDGNL